jgi:hypothetical protein
MEHKKMRRVNVIVESDIYEKARAVAFVRKESISEIFRQAIREWLSGHLDGKAELLLSETDEHRLLKIIESDEFVAAVDAKSILKK